MFWLSRYHRRTRSETAPNEHLLAFDDDCDFCRRSAGFIRRNARTAVVLVPFSELDRHRVLTSLSQRQILASAHYITPEGDEYHGGESITRALRLVRFGVVAGVLDLWGVALLRELGYALMAGNRPLLSSLIRRLFGKSIFP